MRFPEVDFMLLTQAVAIEGFLIAIIFNLRNYFNEHKIPLKRKSIIFMLISIILYSSVYLYAVLIRGFIFIHNNPAITGFTYFIILNTILSLIALIIQIKIKLQEDKANGQQLQP